MKLLSSPPTSSTLPLLSKTAVFVYLAATKLLVKVKVAETGSYSSALPGTFPKASNPPAVKTVPLLSSVAVKKPRAEFMDPVEANVPAVGL